MAYQHKTKEVFILRWNGEEIAEFETRTEARAMRKEYQMAYGGPVYIKRAIRRI